MVTLYGCKVDCCLACAMDLLLFVGPNLRCSAFVTAHFAAEAKFTISSSYVRMQKIYWKNKLIQAILMLMTSNKFLKSQTQQEYLTDNQSYALIKSIL